MQVHSKALSARRLATNSVVRPGPASAGGRARLVVALAAEPERYSEVEQYPRQNEDLLGAFFYGRALAMTLSKRVTGLFVEGLSAVGTAIASRDGIIREFQEEVAEAARLDMEASAGYVARVLEEPVGSTSGSRNAAISSGRGAAPDVQAQIDDLRATIASARSLLQQMRQDQGAQTSRR